MALDPLIAIVGPTAVGKTALSIQLAESYRGEIISADSRQVYRGMDIGTAKPTQEEQLRVRHHLLDVVDPGSPFTLSQYQHLAYAVIRDVHARGKLPFLVGGSGLYVRAVLEGLSIPRVPPNPERRAELEREDVTALYARLQQVDPPAAERIDPRNKRRVVRALEVYEATGRPISVQQVRQAPDYRVLRVGLTMPRGELYERINVRVDAMMKTGLVEEVRGLMAQGYDLDTPSMSGLGYRQITLYVKAELVLEEAVRLLKRDTRRFVHHQYSWFRLDDPRIHWFDASQAPYEPIRELIEQFLAAEDESSGR